MAGKVKATTSGKGRKVEKNLNNPEGIMKMIGALMVADSQKAFKDQAFMGKTWPPRGPVNTMGILRDFANGVVNPPKRRFERRPALRDTGKLSASISFRVVGKNTVEVGSNLPYASVHQKGGETESPKITKAIQEALAKWLRKKPQDIKLKLEWITNPMFTNSVIKTRVPARPFIGLTQQTIRYVRQNLGRKLTEVG